MDKPYALFIDDSPHHLVSNSGRVLPIKARLPKNIYEEETQKKEFHKMRDTYFPKKNFRKLYSTMKKSKEYNVYMNGGMANHIMKKILRYVYQNPKTKYIFLDWDFTIQRNNGTPLNKKSTTMIDFQTILREHGTTRDSYLEFIIGKERLPVMKKMLLGLHRSNVRIIILTANGIPKIQGGKKFMSDILNSVAGQKVMSPRDVYHSTEKQWTIDRLLKEFDSELYCKTCKLGMKQVKKARTNFYKPLAKTLKRNRYKNTYVNSNNDINIVLG